MAAKGKMAATSKPFVLVMLALLILLLFDPSQSAKLNAPKVLLPYYSSVIANFTLEVEFSAEEAQGASCYRWRSTRQEVAQIQLLNSTDGECSNKALVSATSKTSHQMTTVVLAENKVTGEILRCNVIVSEITKLVIDTTTRLLYLEDSPEELVARGYDSEGNIFSSLEGLSFEWSLVSDTETGHDVVDAHNILRIKMYADSHYTTPHHIAPLEDRGLQGDRILAEGIRTGSAKISMKLKDPVYKHIEAIDVRIMVIANLMLSPPDAYVLKFATIKYIVELLKHNTLTKIKMPSPQYYLEMKDNDICSLDTATSVATALEMGSTNIVLKDRNILVTEFFRQPSALIHVVNPGYLAFVVLPTKKWVLETGREYDIFIEVYDKDSHKIYPSDNVRIEAMFPSKYFKVLSSSVNGTYHRVQTVVKGFTDIDGALTAVIREDGSEYAITPNVKGSQEVEIYDPIIVNPPELFFPWDPISQCRHTYKIKASGGSGEYVWSTLNASITSVNIKGEIVTMGLGSTNVTAADAKNSAHTGTVQIHVLPPSDLSFPPTKVEAAISTTLSIPLQVAARYRGSVHNFMDCREMPLNLTYSDGTVFDQQGGDVKLTRDGCTVLNFIAKRQGHTEVTASYQIGNVVLQDSITIAAYNPLKPVDPEKEAVIAVATLKEVVFQGGPQPWVLDSSQYFQTLIPERPAIIKMQKMNMFSVNKSLPSDEKGGYHAFSVLCLDFGEQVLTLNVGNKKTAKNHFPASEETHIRFLCAKPVELHLQPVLNLDPNLPPCPVTHETHLPIPIHCEYERDILVTVTDSSGRRFDNFSSLAITWSVSSTSLASIPNPDELTTDITSSQDSKKIVRTYQTLQPAGKPGTVVVSATTNSYNSRHLRNAGSKISEAIHPRISKSIELQLVEAPFISPEQVSVFNHPSNKVTISIKKGSGYFFIEEHNSDVVGLKYDIKSKSVLMNPLKDGSQTFTVYDLCLDNVQHPTGTVHISGVGSIQVVVLDKVEVRKELKARVQVLDVHGNALLSSFFSLMGLKLEPASDIITVRSSTDKDDKLSAVYTVYGAVVGHTSLTAFVNLPSGETIYSTPKPIEVFPPLRLEPKNVTIIIGAKFQVRATGGPQPQSTIEFSIIDSTISSVSSSGLLEGLELGTTRVVGKAVGTDPITGETVVYSQDDAIVNVVMLAGVRIYSPLTRVQTGTQLPVYAVGLTEHETPFTFGSSLPPLSFHWSVNSRKLVSLKSVYHKSNILFPEESDFAQRLFAVEAGHVTVSLRVTPSQQSSNQVTGNIVLRDEIQIQVFEKLSLVNPSVCDGHILITPNTETIIKTNRDLAARLTYHVLHNSDKSVVTMKQNGIIVSGVQTGTAALHVTAQEDFGVNQTLVILVKVKPVSFVMINADTPLLASSGHLSSIPVGTTLKFSVSYHDDTGMPFFATSVQLQMRCSRYDLLQISKDTDNSTLIVRAAEAGQTILKVWDLNNPWMADYINIPVNYVISPAQAVVSLGAIICFNVPLVSERGYSGSWTVKGTSVDIDPDTGLAIATSVGRSVVINNISADLTTYTEVTVLPVSKATVGDGVVFLSNAPGRKPVNIPVTLGSEDKPLGENCLAELKSHGYQPPFLPFLCRLEFNKKDIDVDVNDLFRVVPGFDSEKGLPVCQVTPIVSEFHNYQQLSTISSKIRLVVLVTQQEGQPELPASCDLEFAPAFYIHNAEIHLTTLAPLSSIRISTLPHLVQDMQASVSDGTLIEALSPDQDSQSGSVVLFPVRLLDSLSVWERETLDLHVELVNRRTGQRAKIPVYIKLIGDRPDVSRLRTVYTRDIGWSTLIFNFLMTYQSWFALFLLILATAVAVLVGYHVLIGPRYRTSANSSAFLNTSQSMSPSPNVTYIQPAPGSPPYNSPYNTSPTRLWSIPYNVDHRGDMSPSTSPYRRSSPHS
ncbi:nuclear pore membrane glycoprotein 210-like isoform X1 [Haliotis asinina]|uniref:nuclear pore membrane glycoprotein 210-like isoform X1 n=1 Tax=Haliotis asinina TaxID=109174 RepID=UPI0035323E96